MPVDLNVPVVVLARRKPRKFGLIDAPLSLARISGGNGRNFTIVNVGAFGGPGAVIAPRPSWFDSPKLSQTFLPS